ncbi:MAG TPA: O-antigen ligase family protein [Candidatus Acidoferrum sp.]|nr:O-antigen ligase family protein [Candidatus Acidoferrum sp.]
MPRRDRFEHYAGTCWVYAVASLALLALGLRAGTGTLLVVCALLAGISALVLFRLSMAQVGLTMTLGFAFMTPWNAVQFGALRPSDVCLALGILAFVCSAVGRAERWPALPPWVLQLAIMIILISSITQLLPFAPSYLQHRVYLDPNALPGINPTKPWTMALRWLAAVLAVPLIAGFAALYRPRALYSMATAYCFGAAASGYLAISDRLHLTSIRERLLGAEIQFGYGNRQSGLTLHPNHLAASTTLAAPIACWLIVRGTPRLRRLGVLALIGALAGVYLSGSRGGAVVSVFCVLLAVVLLHRLRARVFQLGFGLATIVTVVFIAVPSLVHEVANTTRLSGGLTATGSNQARAILGAQSLIDFRHSPIYGIGLQVALSGHEVFQQLLAAGGLLLLGSFLIFVFFGLKHGIQYGRVDQLGVALTISLASWMMLAPIENFLQDRYLYVPVSLIVAAGFVHRRATARIDADLTPESAVLAGLVSVQEDVPAIP